MKKNKQHNSRKAQCVLTPPFWRLSVLIVIQIVFVVLLRAGNDVTTALACASGAGMAAAHVARQLFDLPHTTRAAR